MHFVAILIPSHFLYRCPAALPAQSYRSAPLIVGSGEGGYGEEKEGGWAQQ